MNIAHQVSAFDSGDALYFAYKAHDGAHQENNATYYIGKYLDGSICDIQAPKIEALEMVDNNTLLIGYQDNDQQFVQWVDVLSGHAKVSKITAYRDIKGLAVCLP